MKFNLKLDANILDKNNKKIQDGDIIDIHQTVYGHNLFLVTCNEINDIIIKYISNNPNMHLKKYEYDIGELLEVNEFDKEIEIIGNIYKNPELVLQYIQGD